MILLDTHILIWQEQGDLRLGPQTRRAIARALQEDRFAAVSDIVLELKYRYYGMRVQ